MRTRPGRRRPVLTLAPAAVIAAALALTGCGGGGHPASAVGSEPASSPEPVSAIDHAAGEQAEPVEVSVAGADGVTVTVREITIAPGAGTGVHCHDGQLIGVVTQGRLTHYAAVHEGGVRVYETGESLVEGPGYRHEGRNEGAEDVVLWVTYITPEGMPLAETDLTRCD